MQKVRRHRNCFLLRLIVSVRFQVYFTPLTGVLFTFPSRYLFTIGHQGIFRLGRWSCRIHTGCLCPVLLGIPIGGESFSDTGLSPSMDGPSSPFS